MGKDSTMHTCTMCGERRKKFPASWTLNGSDEYCKGCWAQVECGSCGHHAPKGDIFKGRWTCQSCRHHTKVKLKGSLYEDCHRVIIDDCNGELTLQEVADEVASDQATLQECQHSDEEEQDELAPLPMPRLRPRTDKVMEQGHVVLLIDASGSMRNMDVMVKENGQQADAICRLEAATKCAAEFVHAHSCQQPRDKFSLATFADTAVIEGEVLNAVAMQAALEGVGQRGFGGTSYIAALQAAVELIGAQPTMRSHVVLLSDGRPADTKKALEVFQTELMWKTHIHGIGFGATVQSFAPLQQLTCLSGGTFVLSTCSIQGLGQAFSSVSSTITSMSSGCFNDEGLGAVKHIRPVTFEEPENGVFGRRDVLRFNAARSMFQYDGCAFHEERCQATAVARRARPCMRGGMRLVYGFRDTSVVKDEGSWMVAKASRYMDASCNALAVVESHAKSTAVARHYAARFNERLKTASARKQSSSRKPPIIFFVPCYVYTASESQLCDQEEEPSIFAAERFLPGAFLKYNSNNGYICDDSVQHNEAVQAFTHFSFEASGGKLLVADLQGVARDAETLLTDPQVLSLEGDFGPGDLAAAGMRTCLAAHRCGPTCKRLGLEPLNAKMLQRLAASAGTKMHAASRPSSSLSSDWERLSEASAGKHWEKVSDSGLVEFAMSDGIRSNASEASASSWVHLRDM